MTFMEKLPNGVLRVRSAPPPVPVYGLWAKNSLYTFTWQGVKAKRRLTFPDATVWSGSIAHGSRAEGLVSSWWCSLRRFWKLRWGLTGGSVCRSVFPGMSWLPLPPPFSASCVPWGDQLCSVAPSLPWRPETVKGINPAFLAALPVVSSHTGCWSGKTLRFQHHTLPILCSYFVFFFPWGAVCAVSCVLCPVWCCVCCVLCAMCCVLCGVVCVVCCVLCVLCPVCAVCVVSYVHALSRYPAQGQSSVALSDQWPTKPKIVTICPSTESICSRVPRRKWTHPPERRKWWFLFKIPHTHPGIPPLGPLPAAVLLTFP